MRQRQGITTWAGIFTAVLALWTWGGAMVYAQTIPNPGPQPTLDYRFGVAQANANPALAGELHVGWSRIAFFWNEIEPQPGNYSLASEDNDASLLNITNGGTNLVGVVQGAPTWAEASTPPRLGVETPPAGLYLAWDEPGNTWGQFMYWLARHYAGLINTWVIGNEIGISSGPDQSWDGTPAEFAQMIMVAYQAIKAANPSAKILAPAAPYWYTRGAVTGALLQALGALPGASQNSDYINGIDVNLYSPILANSKIYATYEGLLQANGLAGLPIWLTEANVVTATAAHPAYATPTQEGSFIVEDMATSFAWVSRAEVYKLQDEPTDPEFWGLANVDGTPSAAFTAYQTFIKLMTGATYMNQSLWEPTTNGEASPSAPASATWGEPGELITILWDQGPSPVSVTVPALGSSASLVTMAGGASTILSSNGQYQILLPNATINGNSTSAAPIGGEPQYLIQQVPLGADGTPTTWNVGAPSGFPVTPEGLWTRAEEPITSPPGPLGAAINTAGDQVVIQNSGRFVWIQDAGTGATQLNDPTSFALGIHRWIYVANSGNSDVLIYNPVGHLVAAVGGYGDNPGQLLGVSGVATDAAGTLFVTNTGAQTVDVYSPIGHYLFQWGSWGSTPGHFNGIAGIVVSPTNQVYVADTLNNRVQVFSTTGTYESSIATPDPTTLSWACAPSGGKEIMEVSDGFRGTLSVLPGVSYPDPNCP